MAGQRITQKYSTILIAADDEYAAYRSVHEVPESLRKKLIETTTGRNAITILIADENGRQEILRSLHGLPSSVQSRWVRSILAPHRHGRNPAYFVLRHWRQVVEFALLASIGLVLYLLTTFRP
jgi:hypothetical protein